MKQVRRFKCKEEGCTEWCSVEFSTKADMKADTFYKNWKCIRHTTPNRVMSEDNDTTAVVATVVQGKFDLRWEGSGFLNSTFVTGPGFKAFAADFPIGTKLIVNAHVILPKDLPTKDLV